MPHPHKHSRKKVLRNPRRMTREVKNPQPMMWEVSAKHGRGKK